MIANNLYLIDSAGNYVFYIQLYAASTVSAVTAVSAAVNSASSSAAEPIPVDEYCSFARSGGKVVANFDAMLNKTDLVKHENKFYTLQVSARNGQYVMFTRCEFKLSKYPDETKVCNVKKKT